MCGAEASPTSRGQTRGKRLGVALAAVLMAVSAGGVEPAQAKVKVNKDFRFPAGQPARILLFRLNVQVEFMGLGGMDEANADWTKSVRENLVSQLGQLAQADYALFVYSHDAYGTAGRKVMQFLAAGLLGVGLQAGVDQGYAGLVDLKTGDLVWFNLDPASGGDPRNAEGAAKRVRELLTAFPTSGPAAAPAPAPAAPAAR